MSHSGTDPSRRPGTRIEAEQAQRRKDAEDQIRAINKRDARRKR